MAQPELKEVKKQGRPPRDANAIPTTISIKVDDALAETLQNARNAMKESTGIEVTYQQLVRSIIVKATQ